MQDSVNATPNRQRHWRSGECYYGAFAPRELRSLRPRPITQSRCSVVCRPDPPLTLLSTHPSTSEKPNPERRAGDIVIAEESNNRMAFSDSTVEWIESNRCHWCADFAGVRPSANQAVEFVLMLLDGKWREHSECRSFIS
jgi:hypothetical protein